MNALRWAKRSVVALALALPLVAGATRIDLTPTVTNTTVGSTFMVNVVVSGLSANSPPLAITDFDLDIAYNPALLSATGVSFGTGLGNPADASGFDLTLAGTVDLFALSFADYASLRSRQGDTITLATLSFLALATGTDSLQFVSNAFFIVDMIGVANQNPPVNAADPAHCQVQNCIDVGGARVLIARAGAVPEPDPWLLLGVTCVAWLAARRLRHAPVCQAASA